MATLAAELEQLILAEGPETVAAFIAEPIQAAGGVIVPPATYFPAIQEVLRRYDVLMIADEVVCGFGRTGTMFGSQAFGIEPDLITVAKGHHVGLHPAVRVHRVREGLGRALSRVGHLRGLPARLHVFGAPAGGRGGDDQPGHHRARRPDRIRRRRAATTSASGCARPSAATRWSARCAATACSAPSSSWRRQEPLTPFDPVGSVSAPVVEAQPRTRRHHPGAAVGRLDLVRAAVRRHRGRDRPDGRRDPAGPRRRRGRPLRLLMTAGRRLGVAGQPDRRDGRPGRPARDGRRRARGGAGARRRAGRRRRAPGGRSPGCACACAAGVAVLTAAGVDGRRAAARAGLAAPDVVHDPAAPTGPADRPAPPSAMRSGGVDLVLFVGGDGTARDVAGRARADVRGARRARRGEDALRRCSRPPRKRPPTSPRASSPTRPGWARSTPRSSTSSRAACRPCSARPGCPPSARRPAAREGERRRRRDGDLAALGREVAGEMRPGRLYLLGPGTTVAHVAAALGDAGEPARRRRGARRAAGRRGPGRGRTARAARRSPGARRSCSAWSAARASCSGAATSS